MFSRISKLFMVCIVLTVISGVQQVTAVEMEAGTWTQKADMPTARSYFDAAVVDGKIYAIGGAVVGSFASAHMEEYDPAADTWTICSAMPTPRQAIGAAALDGIVYAIGGFAKADPPFVSIVEAYDPATGRWTRKADMPTPREPCAATVDGKIYVIGGLPPGPGSRRGLSNVEVYDPATDKWTTKADMPTARFDHAACVVDGRIYVSGGNETWPRGSTPTLSSVEVYDPATDTWTQVSDMPWPRYRHTASVVAGKMYLIGGQNTATFKLLNEGKIDVDELEKLFATVDVYDPATDTWTTAASHPFVTAYLASGVVDGKIYTIGGIRDSFANPFSRVDEFHPAGLPDNNASASPAGKLLGTWGEVKSE